MPQRYASHNLLAHLGNPNVFAPEFLASVDADHPRKLLVEAHAPYAGASLINQMLGIDLRFILADGDLPKVTHMCELAGVDVAFPLLDDRVIEFSQRLPSDMKLRGTHVALVLQARAARLPAAGGASRSRNTASGCRSGAWLVGHQPLFDLAADSIGMLRQRGIVQAAVHRRTARHAAARAPGLLRHDGLGADDARALAGLAQALNLRRSAGGALAATPGCASMRTP